jgi:hypothetical protein
MRNFRRRSCSDFDSRSKLGTLLGWASQTIGRPCGRAVCARSDGTADCAVASSWRGAAHLGLLRPDTMDMSFYRMDFRVLEGARSPINQRRAVCIMISQRFLRRRQLKRARRLTWSRNASFFQASRIFLESMSLRVHHLDQNGILRSLVVALGMLPERGDRHDGDQCDDRQVLHGHDRRRQ